MRVLPHPVLVLAVLSTCTVAPLLAATPFFTDVTPEALSQASVLIESVAWGDYDNDGDPDLYLTVSGDNQLLRNDDGTFVDVTTTTNSGGTGNQDVGAAWGDFDNDGWLDLYVVTFSGTIKDQLLRNLGPSGPGASFSFVDVGGMANLDQESSIRSVSLLDYDRDGWLDVFISVSGPDTLYRNLGNMTFDNVTFEAGLLVNNQGVGTVASDLDNDGWPDLFSGNRSFVPNRLFMNDGVAATEGAVTFTDVTTSAGIAKVGLGMGVLSFDYDNDLDFDLYWTTWPNDAMNPDANALYENQGGVGAAITFADATAASGTEDRLGWGVSCNAGDIDNDGWVDFLISNGADPTTTPSVLYQNDADGTFNDVTSALSGGVPADSRGVAFADFDGDGDLDVIITGAAGSPTKLWRNDTATENHWLTLALTGTLSNRTAIGARIEVTTDIRTTVKEVEGGAGRGSFNSPAVEFGLGTATSVARVDIFWPSGLRSVLGGLALDERLSIVESQRFGHGFENGDLQAWDIVVE